MNPVKACEAVHGLLLALPLLERPGDTTVTDGLYLLYEDGEASCHAPAGRIVRVGNHPRSDGTLVRRLRQHFQGRKNGSVFRKHLGGALMRAEDPGHPCLAPGPGKGHWERQGGIPCDLCRPVESRVSLLLRASFRFRCVAVSDRHERNRLEEALVATLSACSICRPSPQWLGHHAYSEPVRQIGMWNSQFVGGPPMSAEELRGLADHVARTPSP